MRETGKRVLIYGATSAMAQEVARLYAVKGASVGLAGRDSEKLRVVAADLTARGAARVRVYSGDLTDTAFQKKSLAEADEELGTLDAVLVAQGVLGDQRTAETNLQHAAEILDVNFTSQAVLLLSVASYFETHKKGLIAVISSVAGDRGRQSNFIYGSAKAGMSAFLQGLRNRLYPSGVHVLTIKPGMVSTPMTAHLKKGLLFARPETVGKQIYQAMHGRRDVVYVPGFWCLIMTIIKMIPEKVFKRLKL
jgi:decaprenylphospho-beta-D-erythro-pentofuranosid-2-ulose 2-reductase